MFPILNAGAALVDWSRAQFALTACYHWLFVPLTLGLGMIMAIMETLYVVKGDEFWKKTAQFWMKLFAINFAIGVATGIILEFEFGTNWSNYSWFTGDIFGAPLAIEGIVAFFMEATFFAVMYFGWNKVGKKAHLTATWLTGIGAVISAFWILVANGWMQHPVGTVFNPDTMRSEMVSFWAVCSNPMAVSKIFHTVFSGWMTGGIFVISVSCWYLLRRREMRFAMGSIAIACLVGLLGGIGGMLSGDKSGVHVAKYQPMKLAAVEGLEDGGPKAGFTIVPGIRIPGLLSILATHDLNGYVPGINDLLAGYTDEKGHEELSVEAKMWRGKQAVEALKLYREYKETDPEKAKTCLDVFRFHEKYLGYGYLESPEDVVPNTTLLFWAFRIMIGLGSFLLLLMLVIQFFHYRNTLQDKRWLLWIGVISLPLVYITSQAGWITAEVGRYPWTIYELLPVNISVSSLSVGAVKTTFWIFVVVFTTFLIAEIRIMLKAIRKGPAVSETWPRHPEEESAEE